jgi:hypothetical protein
MTKPNTDQSPFAQPNRTSRVQIPLSFFFLLFVVSMSLAVMLTLAARIPDVSTLARGFFDGGKSNGDDPYGSQLRFLMFCYSIE